MPCARSLLLLLILVVFTAKLGESTTGHSDSDRDRDEGQVRSATHLDAEINNAYPVECFVSFVYDLQDLCILIYSINGLIYSFVDQTYIVYLGHLPTSDVSEFEDGFSAIEFAHQDLLNQVLDDSRIDSSTSNMQKDHSQEQAEFKILRKRRVNCFSAIGMDGVVSVFPSMTHQLLTTRSWDFLGLPQPSPQGLPVQGEVIVGMLDTGIWPSSPSFSDDGFGLPPSRWKGTCQNFTCNNKIIGVRVYDYRQGSISGLSPLDEVGHGSHTASTVAGRAVANVSFGGLATGTARGAVPGARLAIYKVSVGVF
nr:unnamed protein product [Digitaria exilis]